MGKTVGCNSRLWGPTHSGAPLLSRVLCHLGRGTNHPCPLCDTAPLETSVMEHVLSNHFGGLDLGQEMNLELLLRRLVDLDITFLAKSRNLYSFSVTYN